MPEPWGKLYEKTFQGSMYGAGPVVFSVWCYAVAHMQPPNGAVRLNPMSLCHVIGCSIEEIEKAIAYLCGPDPNSDSKAEEGRRLIEVGTFEYIGVNFKTYRNGRQPEERKAQVRDAVARYRASSTPENVIPDVSHGKPRKATVSRGKPLKAQAEAEAEADKEDKQRRLSRERDSASKAARGARLSPEWTLPEEWGAWARTARPDLDVAESAASFRDYWIAKTGCGASKLDWCATWRNWVRNQHQRPSRGLPERELRARERVAEMTGGIFNAENYASKRLG